MRPGFRCAVVALLLSATGLLAQTTLHVPADQPTIQAGINAAANGDTVLVAPGTYYENIDFKGKAITVTSGATSYAGAAATIIDGSKGNGFAVIFQNYETAASVINGFTIQNPVGGNVNALNTGGGVGVLSGDPTISNNVITHNMCNGVFSQGSPLIEGNEIDNTLDVQGHCAFAAGSAVWLFGSNVVPNARVINNLIQNNTQSSHEDAGGNGGTGVAVWGAYAFIQGNTLRDNVTTGDGGAILAFNTDNVIVIGNLIYGNQAQTDGAISLMPPEATVGPFIGIVASNTIYGNTQIASNSGLGDAPPTQVYLDANLGQYILINNVIYGSGAGSATVSCGTIYNYLSITPLVFDHNDLYNPGGSNYGGACPDQTGTYGNISADPQFIDPATGNFQLAPGSPAIDTGNNSAPQVPATDIVGNPRIQDATGLGYPIIDMGAYEAAPTGSVTSDKAPTILTLTPSTYYPFQGFPNGNANAPFTLTAAATSATGTPVGPVIFYEDQKVVGTVNLSGSGTTVLQPPVPTPGLHSFTASYAGQGLFSAAVSAKFYVLFPKISPTLALTSSANPSQLNSPVTFTVTATSADNAILAPITLTDQTTNTTLATLTPNSVGVATFTTSALPLGNNDIIAFYPGDAAHNSASATLFQDVTNGYATTTSLASSLNPSTYGQSVTLTAQVASTTGTPTGSVQFFNGTVALSGVLPLNAAGVATYTTSALLVGTLYINAVYTPTGSYAASTGYFTQVVNGLPTVTTVSLTPNPSIYGQPEIFSVHVAPVAPNTLVPTGVVYINFCHGAQIPLTLDAAGNATITQPTGTEIAEPVGTCAFSATYQGDTHFAPSTSATLNDVVTPAPSTTTIAATPNPSYALAPVTVSVTVVGNPGPTLSPTGQTIPPGTTLPSGTITLTDGATALGSATVVNGKATFTLTTLALGSHTLTATYAADPNLAGSAASTVVTVLANTTATSLTASPNPGIQGQTITLNASVADTTSAAVPTGTVQFFNGATLLSASPVSANGSASLSLAFTPGLQSLTAVYTPSSTAFLPSSSTAVALPIAAQDFSFTTTEPTITIQTQHHASLPLTLTSIGGFSGPVSVACTGTLPAWLTCETPVGTTLAANATLTGTFTLDTDQLLNFLSRSQPPAAPGSRLPITLATLLPLSLLGLRNRRKLHRVLCRSTLAVLTLALAATTLTACSGYYPHSTAPGTYTIPLTATGTSNGIATPITHTLNITLTVTP